MEHSTTSRRGLLKAAPVIATIAVVPYLGASAAAQGDTVLVEAWQRRSEAFAIYNALPCSETDDPYTPEEAAQWAIIDAAEETIRSAVATTPQGIAIQLWTQLSHNLTKRDEEAAARRRDFAYFDARDDQFDWPDRLVIAALRSLQSMEA